MIHCFHELGVVKYTRIFKRTEVAYLKRFEDPWHSQINSEAARFTFVRSKLLSLWTPPRSFWCGTFRLCFLWQDSLACGQLDFHSVKSFFLLLAGSGWKFGFFLTPNNLPRANFYFSCKLLPWSLLRLYWGHLNGAIAPLLFQDRSIAFSTEGSLKELAELQDCNVTQLFRILKFIFRQWWMSVIRQFGGGDKAHAFQVIITTIIFVAVANLSKLSRHSSLRVDSGRRKRRNWKKFFEVSWERAEMPRRMTILPGNATW